MFRSRRRATTFNDFSFGKHVANKQAPTSSPRTRVKKVPWFKFRFLCVPFLAFCVLAHLAVVHRLISTPHVRTEKTMLLSHLPPERPKILSTATDAVHASSSSPITKRAMQLLMDTGQTSQPADIITSRHPKRIPGYLANSNRTLFGYVMRDFLTRICSRQIAKSHVVGIGANSSIVAQRLLEHVALGTIPLEEELGYTVATSTLVRAARQGHGITGLEPMAALSTSSPLMIGVPNWVILAMFDAAHSNDAIFEHWSSAGVFQNHTITYIVVGVGADRHDDGSSTFFGLKAVQLLAELKYKVQILSLSHSHTEHRPNRMLKTDDSPSGLRGSSAFSFFRWMRNKAQVEKKPVRGYLFATQGLDLAIPTATQHIYKVKRNEISYHSCTATKASLSFTAKAPTNYEHRTSAHEATSTFGEKLTSNGQELHDVWTSHAALEQSEAACARFQLPRKGKRDEVSSACATRILPASLPLVDKAMTTNNSTRPNLLLIMLDPMSRARFEHSLPKTKRVVDILDFVSFSNYTAVGNNSGPNQVALYSGESLSAYDSVKTHVQQQLCNKSSSRREWLWETLAKEGYATFKAEDGCIENSNMIQSINPQTHHGNAFNRMMCYDFSWPNCVGSTSAAQQLMDHSDDFIRYYAGSRPWAAMLHLIDSHEDTMTIEGTLDELLWTYLSRQRRCKSPSTKGDGIPCADWENTLIVLISDHGLHYGNYMLSREGLRERYQPLLHMRLPGSASRERKRMLASNKDLVTTPFDVYTTVLDVLLGRRGNDTKGLTMLEAMPKEREVCSTTPVVPDMVCNILQERSPPHDKAMMPNPPSALSFNADIPAENKKGISPCFETAGSKLLFTNGTNCMCSSNILGWHNCTEDPWSSSQPSSETFRLIKCEGKLSAKIRVNADPVILKRREIQEQKVTTASREKPNILFIEVDSVSFAFADRHFPKTRELLERHRLKQTGTESHECSGGMCSVEFPYFSISGSNSIPNQIAVFGGCIVTTGPERCMAKTKVGANIVCKDPSHAVHDMYLASTHRKIIDTWCHAPTDNESPGPWIFDTAKGAGYVTLFAEEFCYDNSPWVSQGNIFPLHADILPHKMFCRAKESDHFGQLEDPCISGAGSFPRVQVSLEHIEQMWDAYPDTPKLAYLSAIAAHSYEAPMKMSQASDSYDTVLSSFLEGMLQRDDAKKTIIVVRGDHGLQGGKMVADYSTQVEVLRPWTEIIVPEDLKRLSLSALFQNQNQLVTGHDLYRTLAESIATGHHASLPGLPPWSLNIFTRTVPESRTCADAKVPLSFCIFDDQRTDTSPNFGVCNLLEDRQSFMCPENAKLFKKARAAELDDFETEIVAKNTIESIACPKRGYQHSDRSQVLQQWQRIDELVGTFPNSKVSGGIFLYPRQASLLSSVIRFLSEAIHEEEKRDWQVCETGFGAGHSAALFLSSSEHTVVHTFDKFDRDYQFPVLEALQRQHSGRLIQHVGDSCRTIPSLLNPAQPLKEKDAKQCDFLHGSSLCATDNIDLVENAPCGIILTSTAMKSLTDGSVYFGPSAQWRKLEAARCIRDISCFAEEKRTLDRSFVFNRAGASIDHKFCLAITTGLCSKLPVESRKGEGACNTGISQITSRLDMLRMCPSFQVLHPDAAAA